ncbi:MAG: KH domain-containing protein [Patescibacteria group bacterium]|nr:KH domain-containing protein [Patescibacteria group bacterium]
MDKKAITKKELKDIEKTIKDLLKYLEIEGDFTLTENDEGIEVVLNTKDTGIVIGYHGEVLEALQLVFSLVISKKIGWFVRISLEVGDYKKNRIDFVKNLALQTKERVLLEKKEFTLPNLRSWERRIVHLSLQDDKEVVSESIGEGKDRVLIIKPRG